MVNNLWKVDTLREFNIPTLTYYVGKMYFSLIRILRVITVGFGTETTELLR